MQGGTIRLFRFAGIQVYLHFTWFIVAAYQLQSRAYAYSRPIFALYEYLALFAMVTMHEFGHALACRQTGGYADRIILWPLGGVAFVQPPRRPGAMLWSLAAGPLVNVALVPVLEFIAAYARLSHLFLTQPDVYRLIVSLRFINLALLIFNMLPVYPLDGGQIVRSLLWFVVGEIRSLKIASVIGLIGGAALASLALYFQSFWSAIMAFFLLSRAVAGWQQAKLLMEEEKLMRDAQTIPTAPERRYP